METFQSTDSPGTADPLAPLMVIDRLEVGPIRLEPRRLIAPYRVFQDGSEASIDLICRYEEPVFDPLEPESRNIAAMIAAQVALNYGLFCREIVFTGLFDRQDRRFLRAMAENTAREIYVKKILEPNPFLKGPALGLPAVGMSRYLRARLVFTGRAEDRRLPTRWSLWQTDRQRCCILSSGGKDSLLSFGLMREVAQSGGPSDTVHPVFVNESGRHWFTALNAYRQMREQVPTTARVWVNSDRVFAWMLRRLPFIRPDFADIRADIYPIRLWTVAVFLFAVLPVMRKRKLGRLLIGDEYDSTTRAVYRGISHYDGLYDQSVYFDRSLSGYFLQKGWAISQFSILRPLSELLIEKILVERYPELQRLQMSCHAASKGEDRVIPCGRCEKCRRIVGMLLAIGADPGPCGFTERQVRHCLSRISARDVHQGPAETAQLIHMLTARGLIDPAGEGDKVPDAHPEVLKLRFDGDRSPIHGIPVDLRRPLIRIFREHASGAVRKKGNRWIEVDPLAMPELHRPFAFEVDPAPGYSPVAAADIGAAARTRWGAYNWPDAERYLKTVDVALLPVGAIEQHGPHLPLDTDTFDAQYLADRVAEACGDPRPMVLPVIPFGVSYHHRDFRGTLSISNETLSRLVYDIGMSAAENGIRKLVIINGHGGNAPALNYAAQLINRDARIFVCVDTGETSDVDIARLVKTPNDVHAGEIETSTSLAVRPHLVKMDRAVKSVPEFSSRYLDFSSKRGVSWYAFTRRISSSGVMGDATLGDAGKGRQIWEVMIAHLVALVEDLKQMTLDEIHQRRY